MLSLTSILLAAVGLSCRCHFAFSFAVWSAMPATIAFETDANAAIIPAGRSLWAGASVSLGLLDVFPRDGFCGVAISYVVTPRSVAS